MRDEKLTILRTKITELFVHVVFGEVERIPDNREPWGTWWQRERVGRPPFCPPKDSNDNYSKHNVEECGVESGHDKLYELYSIIYTRVLFCEGNALRKTACSNSSIKSVLLDCMNSTWKIELGEHLT